MNMLKVENRKGDKIYFRYDFGRGAGQRPSTGIFIYKNPKNQIQKNHNKEAMALLAVKQSQLTIESQAIGSDYIPRHNFKDNFLDYYKQFVEDNKREGNRHQQGRVQIIPCPSPSSLLHKPSKTQSGSYGILSDQSVANLFEKIVQFIGLRQNHLLQ